MTSISPTLLLGAGAAAALALKLALAHPKSLTHVDLNAYRGTDSADVRSHPKLRPWVDASGSASSALWRAGKATTTLLGAAQSGPFRGALPPALSGSSPAPPPTETPTESTLVDFLSLFDFGRQVVNHRVELLPRDREAGHSGARDYAAWSEALRRVERSTSARATVWTGWCPSTMWVAAGRLTAPDHPRILHKDMQAKSGDTVSSYDVFDLSQPSALPADPRERKLKATRIPGLTNAAPASSGPAPPLAVHVFVTLNPARNAWRTASEDAVLDALPRKCETRGFVIEPASGEELRLTPENFGQLRAEIADLVQAALAAEPGGRVSRGPAEVVTVSTAAPAPLNYALGTSLSRAVASKVITFEFDQGAQRYVKAFEVV